MKQVTKESKGEGKHPILMEGKGSPVGRGELDLGTLEQFRQALRYMVCYHLGVSCHDVEDVVQETLVRFIALKEEGIHESEGLGDFQGDPRVLGFLARICDNVILEYQRHIWRDVAGEPRSGEGGSGGAGGGGAGIGRAMQLMSWLMPGKSELARVAGHVANDLHDPKSGRLDARRIAEYLQVSLACIASAAGKEAAFVRRSPVADSIQEGLAPVARTVAILAQFLGSRQQVRAWLHSPHPDLDGQSPMSLIQAGKPEAVADMLDAALAGQPL